MLKTRDLWLLDVITYLNGKSIEYLEAPFDEEVKKLRSGSLVIERSRSIKYPFTLLDKGEDKTVISYQLKVDDSFLPFKFNTVDLLHDATHVIAMRNTGQEKFGIATTMKAEKVR